MEIKLKAPAKINLSLDVRGKRPDGYHELSTVMQTVSLYDEITMTDNDSGRVTISCDYAGVPCDDRNICAKAAYKFFDYCRLPVSGVHIRIDKTIPTQAGLAGGSGNGAAVLHGLNVLWDLGLGLQQLCDAGAKLGSDVPFCVMGQAAENEALKECAHLTCHIAKVDWGTHHEPVGLCNFLQDGCKFVLELAYIGHLVLDFACHTRHATLVVQIVQANNFYFNLVTDRQCTIGKSL